MNRMRRGWLLAVAGMLGVAALVWGAEGPKGPPGGKPGPAESVLGPQETIGKMPVLLVKGMWCEHWKLNEALSLPAGRYGVANSYVTQRYGYAFALKYFPQKPEELQRYKIVVLGNVPTTALAREGPRNDMKVAAGGRSDQWLVNYVAQGGGLLVLGGSFSFDLESTTRAGSNAVQNTYKDSALAQILPVELTAKATSVADQNIPLELTPSGPHALLKGVDFTARPMTLFYHPMTVRKEGTVVLTAGKDGPPILVVGTYGKGRVAVFLATLHGDPAKETTPYWEWAGWPVLVRNVVDWLGQQE